MTANHWHMSCTTYNADFSNLACKVKRLALVYREACIVQAVQEGSRASSSLCCDVDEHVCHDSRLMLYMANIC